MFDEKAKKSFIQELSLMYLFVENDLFVRLYGYHEQPYLMVMKYYAGGALEHFLFHKRPEDFVFSIEVKLKFIMQISRAISEMHKLGLAHADLKLLNVFVDISQKIEGGSKEYNCVLGDFGLSLIVDESQLLVRAYQVFNRRGLTMAYAAPEVIQRFKAGKPFLGWNPAVIKSGDLFAFSIIMFELLEEKRAWK
jgi:serine/threonine protein kinase